MFYPRTILKDLIREINSREIVVLTGMRQVGKTTLLRHLFDTIPSSNKAFFDAENPLHRKLFEEEHYDNVWRNLEPFGITRKERAFIFIDEVQLMPDLTSVAKYLHDHFDVKLFLTGSSSFALKNLFPESMAGRKMIFTLSPLTFAEFLIFRGRKYSAPSSFREKAATKTRVAFELFRKDYAEYLRTGGFPAAVLEESPERRKRKHEEIFTSYFEHDVKSLADFRETSRLRDLLLLLVPRIGSKLDITRISGEISLGRETIYSYLEFLEQTYFLHLLPRHAAGPDRRAAGSKKVYFCDVGMARTLGNLSDGQILEQAVFQSLSPFHRMSYYGAKGGKEIDFIIDDAVALEVKTSVTDSDRNHLERRRSDLHLPESYVASLQWSADPADILAQDL